MILSIHADHIEKRVITNDYIDMLLMIELFAQLAISTVPENAIGCPCEFIHNRDGVTLNEWFDHLLDCTDHYSVFIVEGIGELVVTQ